MPKARVYLDPGEIALEARWEDGDRLFRFLREQGIEWRFDPVFQYVVVTNRAAAETLTAEFGCKDLTKQLRVFLKRKHGARIVGCNDFRGMLVYNIADGLVYHVDATSFMVSPVPDMKLVYCFRGLGRAAAYGEPLEFESVPKAVEAFREAVRKAQLRWLSTYKRKAGRTATPQESG